MADNTSSLTKRQTTVPFYLISTIIILIYSNSLDTPWQLDDYSTIVANINIQLEDLKLDSLYNAFHAGNEQRILRPIAYLTFALNWYIGQKDVFGYHVINTIIHILNSWLLFLTILSIFNSPKISKKYSEHTYNIALLATILWCINPVQTQAVTYIVQRMASMGTTFYLIGLYLYFKVRLNSSKRFIYCSGIVLSFILGVATKENVITLPIAITIAEIIFFQHLNKNKIRQIIIYLSISTSIFALLSILIFIGNPENILAGYNNRFFTATQRLLTEPRIIVFYVSLLFYPMPARLSLEHDVIVSTSIFQPWTTLPSIIIVFICLFWGITQINKRPIVSFSILFFFLNHVIESTILPLELIFEHRNYLPSLFIFLPVAILLNKVLIYYQEHQPLMHKIFIIFIIMLIGGVGGSTYIRNMAWSTQNGLLLDCIKKAPNSARPIRNLARYYLETGHRDIALALNLKALNLTMQRKDELPKAQFEIAMIHYQNGNKKSAIRIWKELISKHPYYARSRAMLARALIDLEFYDEAIEQMDILVKKYPNNLEFINLAGLIYKKSGQLNHALNYYRRSISLDYRNKAAIIEIGIIMNMMDEFNRAQFFLERAHSLYPEDTSILIWLIANAITLNNRSDKELYITKLISKVNVKELNLFFRSANEDKHLKPVAEELSEQLKKTAMIVKPLNQ